MRFCPVVAKFDVPTSFLEHNARQHGSSSQQQHSGPQSCPRSQDFPRLFTSPKGDPDLPLWQFTSRLLRHRLLIRRLRQLLAGRSYTACISVGNEKKDSNCILGVDGPDCESDPEVVSGVGAFLPSILLLLLVGSAFSFVAAAPSDGCAPALCERERRLFLGCEGLLPFVLLASPSGTRGSVTSGAFAPPCRPITAVELDPGGWSLVVRDCVPPTSSSRDPEGALFSAGLTRKYRLNRIGTLRLSASPPGWIVLLAT